MYSQYIITLLKLQGTICCSLDNIAATEIQRVLSHTKQFLRALLHADDCSPVT